MLFRGTSMLCFLEFILRYAPTASPTKTRVKAENMLAEASTQLLTSDVAQAVHIAAANDIISEARRAKSA